MIVLCNPGDIQHIRDTLTREGLTEGHQIRESILVPAGQVYLAPSERETWERMLESSRTATQQQFPWPG